MADILIKMLYQEENAKAVAEATARLEKMTDAEKDAALAADKLADSTRRANEAASKIAEKEATDRIKQLAAAEKEAARQAELAHKKIIDSYKKIQDAGDKMANVGGKMSMFVTAPLLAAGAASVKFASDLQETQSQIGVIFGEMGDDVIAWSKTSASAMGMSSNQALGAAATFASLGKSAGLSGRDLVNFGQNGAQLAADFASFKNTSADEAITAMGAAMRGEMEPIRRYDILLDDTTVRAEALRLGIVKNTKDALLPQQRVLAVNSLLFAKSSDAQGDFARTSNQVAGSTKKAKAELENAAAALGEKLLPLAAKGVGFISDLTAAFNGLSDEGQNAVLIFGGVAAAMGPVLTVGGNLVKMYGALKLAQADITLKGGLGAVLSGAASGLGAMAATVAPLALLAAGLVAITKTVDEIGNAAKATTQDLIAMSQSGDLFKQAGAYVEMFGSGWERIGSAFVGTAEEMKAEVVAGTMSIEDYNNAIRGMAASANQWGKGGLGDKLAEQNMLTEDAVDLFRQLKTQEREAGEVFAKYLPDVLKWVEGLQAAANIKIAAPDVTDLSKLAPDKLSEAEKEYGSYQDKLTGLETKHQADREKVIDDTSAEIDALRATWGEKRLDMIADFNAREAEELAALGDKRTDILSSWAEAEQEITDKQNEDRMKLARQYGEDTVRAEQDYQRARERDAQDHGRRISKLADDRDALGIEDEMDAYALESKRAQEDYQTTAARRSEDYAQQLADLNAAADEQRAARAREKDRQLAEAEAQYAEEDRKRQAANAKALADLDKQTNAEQQKIIDSEAKKLSDLEAGLSAEQAATNAAWVQWRNEHDIFFAGERAAWDAHLAYMHNSLIASQTAAGFAGQTQSPTTTPTGHASGIDMIIPPGYNENYPLGYASSGERFTVQNQGQQFRGLQLGGGAMGGRSISINMGGLNIMQPSATPAQIQTIVHRELIAVADEVTKRQAAQR